MRHRRRGTRSGRDEFGEVVRFGPGVLAIFMGMPSQHAVGEIFYLAEYTKSGGLRAPWFGGCSLTGRGSKTC